VKLTFCSFADADTPFPYFEDGLWLAFIQVDINMYGAFKKAFV
jgi:hypothetical protein